MNKASEAKGQGGERLCDFDGASEATSEARERGSESLCDFDGGF